MEYCPLISTFAGMKQAMIFAAGLGTRLKPLTDTMPKALVRVGGEPLLWHVIMKLKKAGYERIVVNVHHFANQITDYLAANDYFGLDIRISDETEALLETGGGIKKALPLFDPSEPILIHNVDILSNLDLNALPMDAPLLVVSERKTKRYLMFDDDMRLQGWTNIETGEVKGHLSPLSALHSPLNLTLRYTQYAGHRDTDVDVYFNKPVADYHFSTGIINVKGSSEYSDHQGLRGCWGTDWPSSDHENFKPETVGLGICIPSQYIKSEEPANKDQYTFVIGTSDNHLNYKIIYCSDNESFGYHSDKEWFDFLKNWKQTDVEQPIKVNY